MKRKPHVTLAVMTNAAPELLQRAVDSARHMIDSAHVVVAPRAFDCLPKEGFGYCALETRVHQVPWAGYAATRTKTYELASEDERADWVLMIDADDVFAPGSKLPELDLDEGLNRGPDAYAITVDHRGPGHHWRWRRHGHLMRARAGFRWEGAGGTPYHERLEIPMGRTSDRWDGLVCSTVVSGGEPKRFGSRDWEREIAALRQATAERPYDARAVYYLAQTLKDAGHNEEAFEAFHQRIGMGGDDGERFWAKLSMGKLAADIHRDPVRYYLRAHHHMPERAEPLRGIADHMIKERRFALAEEYGNRAHACRYPKHADHFVDVRCYSAEALREVGIE